MNKSGCALVMLISMCSTDVRAQEKDWFTIVCDGQKVETDLDGIQKPPVSDVRSFNVFADFSVKYKTCIQKDERGALCYLDIEMPTDLFPWISVRYVVSLDRVTGKVTETEWQAYDVRGLARDAGLSESQTRMLLKTKADKDGFARKIVQFDGICKKADAKKF